MWSCTALHTLCTKSATNNTCFFLEANSEPGRKKFCKNFRDHSGSGWLTYVSKALWNEAWQRCLAVRGGNPEHPEKNAFRNLASAGVSWLLCTHEQGDCCVAFSSWQPQAAQTVLHSVQYRAHTNDQYSGAHAARHAHSDLNTCGLTY